MDLIVAIQQQTAVLKEIAREMGEVKQMVQMLLES
jgi:methyl-accepting chemotaxis protein